MKLLVWISFLLTCTTDCFSQLANFSGTVRDLYWHQPIPGAKIYLNEKLVALANRMGAFHATILINQNTYITIHAQGYAEKTFPVDSNTKFKTIFLDAVNYEQNSIQVRGLDNGTSLLESPGSIANLVSKDLNRNNLINFSNTFNLIPGARMEFRNASIGARIILRGYGNQNNNTGVGYKAYYNDIPITDADGTTVLDEVDFATLGRVEVFKGPVSSVYGSGIGGVVNLLSEKAPEGTTIRQSVMGGTNNLMRMATTVGVGNDKNNIVLNYGTQKTDGWRLHDNAKKDFWNIKASIVNSAKSTYSIFAAYTHSMDQIPGEVDSFGLVNYPDTADLTNIKNNSKNDLESFRIGITQEYHFSEKLSNKTTVFLGKQENDQWVATIRTKTDKNTVGARSSFNLRLPIGNVDALFTLGTEVISNRIDQKSYNLTNGIVGALRSNQELIPMQWNAFGKIELLLAKRTLMVFSGAANFVSYNNNDFINSGGGYINQTGFKRFQPLLTPRWVINHLINKHFSLYSNYSMGFGQPATNQVIIAQTGKVNNNIKPEISNTFEVGGKASLLQQRLYLDFAYYNMEVTDKILPQNFPAAGLQPAYSAFVNNGVVNLAGVEMNINYVYKPKQKNFIQLIRPFLNYLNNSSKNIDLKSDNNANAATKDYSNFRVSGLPRNTVNMGIDFEVANGGYLHLTDMYTDNMPVTLDNSVFADSYNLINIKAGYKKSIYCKGVEKYSFDFYWGMNNVYNAKYAQFVVINLFPVSGQAPKFFSPGAPSSIYGGLSFRYRIK